MFKIKVIKDTSIEYDSMKQEIYNINIFEMACMKSNIIKVPFGIEFNENIILVKLCVLNVVYIKSRPINIIKKLFVSIRMSTHTNYLEIFANSRPFAFSTIELISTNLVFPSRFLSIFKFLSFEL